MSLGELLPAIHSLSRTEKLRLIAEVAGDLAQDEKTIEDASQLASLRNSPEMAQALQKMLDKEKAGAA